MTKQEIKAFLKEFGTPVNACSQDAELMMDDHICISWYGTEYYVKENNMFYSDFDYEIVEHLNEKHHV